MSVDFKNAQAYWIRGDKLAILTDKLYKHTSSLYLILASVAHLRKRLS